jgi:hypothetical protein
VTENEPVAPDAVSDQQAARAALFHLFMYNAAGGADEANDELVHEFCRRARESDSRAEN